SAGVSPRVEPRNPIRSARVVSSVRRRTLRGLGDGDWELAAGGWGLGAGGGKTPSHVSAAAAMKRVAIVTKKGGSFWIRPHLTGRSTFGEAVSTLRRSREAPYSEAAKHPQRSREHPKTTPLTPIASPSVRPIR